MPAAVALIRISRGREGRPATSDQGDGDGQCYRVRRVHNRSSAFTRSTSAAKNSTINPTKTTSGIWAPGRTHDPDGPHAESYASG